MSPIGVYEWCSCEDLAPNEYLESVDFMVDRLWIHTASCRTFYASDSGRPSSGFVCDATRSVANLVGDRRLVCAHLSCWVSCAVFNKYSRLRAVVISGIESLCLCATGLGLSCRS